jgi:hypothetical protein
MDKIHNYVFSHFFFFIIATKLLVCIVVTIKFLAYLPYQSLYILRQAYLPHVSNQAGEHFGPTCEAWRITKIRPKKKSQKLKIYTIRFHTFFPGPTFLGLTFFTIFLLTLFYLYLFLPFKVSNNILFI